MAIYLGRWAWGLRLAGVLVLGEANFLGSPTLAQITPDSTLGAESSVVTPNVNVKEFPADRIDGGAVRGANLFHSFQEFNIGDGQRVYFANPTGIENILSRVTGNNLSNILGTLGVDGGASLFLLNPNGIIFGPNAQLDIAGSFVASTANSVVFDNGFEFNAKNPATPPLLTVNVPLGVQYGTNQPRTTITNTGNLAVGQNLTLDAGNLDLQGQVQAGNNLTLQAQDTVKIRDSVTNPFIAAAGSQLLVQGNQLVDIFALNHPNSGLYSGGDMVLRSPDAVMGDAHYWSGGNFRIEKLDGSLGDLESPYDPIIRASGDVSFTSYTGASLHIFAGGSVNISGTVTITGTDTLANSISENVTLSDAITVAPVNGNVRPTVDIRAGTTAFNPTGITPPNAGVFTPGQPGTGGTPTNANITIGNIDVPGANGFVLVTNQYQPNLALPGGNIQLGAVNARSDVGNGGLVFIDSRGSLTISPGFISSRSSVGNSGDIVVIAKEAVSLSRNAYIGTATVGANSRNAGNITIKAGSLLVNPGSFIDAGTRGRGDAGIININVRDTISLSDSFISSSVESGAIGNGGIVNIDAGSVLISNAGLFVNTGIGASGTGGRLIINAGTVQVADGGVIDASTLNVSDAGSITLNVNNLEVIRGGQILTASNSTGKAGDLFINNSDTVTVNSQGIITTGSTSTGDSGNLSINTKQFNLSDPGSVVGTNSFGGGKAGDLFITNADTVTVSNQGLLSTGSLGSGNGGTLSISTRQLDVINSGGVDGGISTTAIGTGNSGNLLILATESMNVLSGGNVITSSDKGTGIAGSIDITTNRLSIRDNSFVVSSTLGAGDAGDVTVRATDSIEVVNLSKLSANTLGSGNGGDIALETGSLSVRNGGEVSTSTNFNSSGRGGNLLVTASDSVELIEGYLLTTTFGQGDSGDLSVTTRKLTARDGGRVEAGTRGTGRGGDVIVNASESVDLSGSSADGNILVFSAVSASSGSVSIEGSGNVNLTTGQLIIRDGAEITTTTLGPGEGGDIEVKANSVSLTDSGNITSRTDGQGNGGDIQLSANSLSLKNNASISSRSDAEQFNAGDAGNINLNVTGDLRSNGGIISATSEQAGGGDIKITADDIRLRDGSLISTSVFDSTGGGGNIAIYSTVFLAIEDSDILANAEAGPGGDITINASGFLADLFSSGAAVPVGRNPGDLAQFRGNGRNDISVSAGFRGNDRVDISADSRTGTSGAVVIRGSFSERRVNPLPSSVDAEELIDRRCTPSSNDKKSSFTITGRGGLPPNPNDPLTNQDVLVDWITLQDREEAHHRETLNPNPTAAHPTQLVEAQSWVIGSEGQVILTAAAPTVMPASSGLVAPSCEDNQAATP